jgi:GntR family transcriptional regulator
MNSRKSADKSLPLYHQVHLTLRQRILDGVYGPDSPIPTEQELTTQFGVSRITVRRALGALTEEGLIRRERGRGTFVSSGMYSPQVQISIRGLIENLMAMGLKTRAELIEFGYVVAPQDVRGLLELAPDGLVQRSVRVRSHQNQPFSHLVAYIPEAIGRNFDKDDLSLHPLLTLLERSGVKVASAYQTISARAADSDVAPLLQVPVGTPLISITRLVRDVTGQPVELIRCLYRPDRYEYGMVVERATDDGALIWRDKS